MSCERKQPSAKLQRIDLEKGIALVELCPTKFFGFLISLFLTGPAFACSVMPTLQETQRNLRLTVETADYVIIGRVSHILRRRWTDDDTQPNFHPKWLEYLEKSRSGEDVGAKQYIVNIVEFAEATAYIEVDEELFWTGLKDSRHTFGKPLLLPVDMLRPFTVAGHGPCYNFPRTCPWDVQPGELVAVALKEN